MIRLSRMGGARRSTAYLASAILVAIGCAQNGIGNGGLGGRTGKGGAQAGAGGASSGAGGAIGGNGDPPACPLDKPVPGTPCTGFPHCSYGTTICCGVAMTDTLAGCTGGLWTLQSNDTTCRLGLACPSGGTSGQGGGAGSLGAGGAGGVAGMNCPATPTNEGFSCLPGDPFLGCTYGSVTCCGVTYPDVQVTCQQDSVVHQAVENPCEGGYVCPTGGGGAGGASGITTCPANPPTATSGFGATSCAASLVCNYGSRSCCGKSVPDQVFECSAGGILVSEALDCPVCPTDASTDALSDAGGGHTDGGTDGPR